MGEQCCIILEKQWLPLWINGGQSCLHRPPCLCLCGAGHTPLFLCLHWNTQDTEEPSTVWFMKAVWWALLAWCWKWEDEGMKRPLWLVSWALYNDFCRLCWWCCAFSGHSFLENRQCPCFFWQLARMYCSVYKRTSMPTLYLAGGCC